MNDEWLYGLRREPRPEFADRLRARLAHQSQATPTIAATWPVRRIVTTSAVAAVAASCRPVRRSRSSRQTWPAQRRGCRFGCRPRSAIRAVLRAVCVGGDPASARRSPYVLDRLTVGDAIRLWRGDSRGSWENDTLIVETTNFNGKGGFMGSGTRLHLIERFRRTAVDTVLYEFTVF